MKLNIKYKKQLAKKDSQKKVNKVKKSKGPKLLKDYTDNSECDIDNTSLVLTQMRYGTINSCDVDFMSIGDQTIELKHSWLEALLIMLSTVIVNNSNNLNNLNNLFEENGVTNTFFIVDKVYGKYSFDEQYKAYKIPDTDYYLEYTDTSRVIFEALVGLTKCLDIPLNEISWHLVNKAYRNTRLNFDSLEEAESIVTIDNLNEMLTDDIHLVSLYIFGEIVSVHRLDVALLAICNKIFDEYGVFKLSILPSNNSTGVKVLEDGDELNSNIVRIRDSEVGLYCDGDNNGIIQFISNSMTYLSIDKNMIKFKFKSLRDKTKHEWETE